MALTFNSNGYSSTGQASLSMFVQRHQRLLFNSKEPLIFIIHSYENMSVFLTYF